MITSAFELLGRFHAVMNRFAYNFRSQHPLHDTEYHLDNLERALSEKRSSPWWKKVSQLAFPILEKLPQLFLPDELPRRIVHGDPKISNFLFDSEQRAVALLDLDTCNRHFTLVDLGDAIRAWCGIEVGDGIYFSLDNFSHLVKGYLNSGFSLTSQEWELLPRSGLLITLELTARFLTDTLEESYFAWDPQRFPSRAAHNFYRAERMFSLAEQIEDQSAQMNEIISQVIDKRGD